MVIMAGIRSGTSLLFQVLPIIMKGAIILVIISIQTLIND